MPVHIALIDQTGEIPTAELFAAAGALSEQIQADFVPVWKVAASVGVHDVVATGTWQIVIQAQLDDPGALGYHTDDNNQPISYVELTNSWTTTVSHESLEMLADPWGNRIHSARLPAGLEEQFAEFKLANDTSLVKYLLEVCDPCEERSYDVGGVPLSDFILPAWYSAMPVNGLLAYSHAEDCLAPRTVPSGGYVSFSNHDGEWFQVFNVGNGSLQVQDIGRFDRAQFGSLREFADANARHYKASMK
jgi:hypothetical protein